MKNLKKLFISALLVIVSSLGLYAQTQKYGLIYTEADYISEADLSRLNTELINYGEKYNCGIYVVVVDSLAEFGYEDIDSGAEQFYKDVEFGVGPENNGLMLFISVEDNDYDILVFGSHGYDIFTDDVIAKLYDNLNYYVENSDNIKIVFESYLDDVKSILDSTGAIASTETSPSTAAASDSAETGSYGIISVESNLLSETELNELNSLAQSKGKKHDFGIYAYIVEDMNNYDFYDIEDFAESVYKEADLGIGSENNGILLVLSLAERDYDICAHGSVGHYSFTDYGKQEIFGDMKYDLKNDNWYKALKTYVESVDNKLTEAENAASDIENYSGSSRMSRSKDGNMNYGLMALIAVVIAFIIALITCFILRAPMKNVKIATGAGNYVVSNLVNFTARTDQYTHRTTSRVKINNNNSSGGTSINSGGFSHSSGKF